MMHHRKKPRSSFRITDKMYNKSLVPNQFVASKDKGNIHKRWKPHTGGSIGYPAWNLLYYTVLTCLNPERFNTLIEVGTNYGLSSIMIGQAIKDCPFAEGRCYTIDIDEEKYKLAKSNIVSAGVKDYVEPKLGDSLEVLPRIVKEGVSFAFIDGKHECNQVLAEFELIRPHLAPEGVIMFDNARKPFREGEEKVYHGLQKIKEKYGGNLVTHHFVSWGTPGIATWQA